MCACMLHTACNYTAAGSSLSSRLAKTCTLGYIQQIIVLNHAKQDLHRKKTLIIRRHFFLLIKVKKISVSWCFVLWRGARWTRSQPGEKLKIQSWKSSRGHSKNVDSVILTICWRRAKVTFQKCNSQFAVCVPTDCHSDESYRTHFPYRWAK